MENVSPLPVFDCGLYMEFGRGGGGGEGGIMEAGISQNHWINLGEGHVGSG